MARLISPPVGLRYKDYDFLSGPRAIGGASNTSIGNFTQTVSSPFGLWRIHYSFPPLRGTMFRRYRGWVSALAGGANATRWQFCDWDTLSYVEAGIASALSGQNWSNGQTWSNGQQWQGSYPTVAVAQAAAVGDTTVYLADSFWGHNLGVGDVIGFMPFHFGMYEITEVFAAGQYRIWPSLRVTLTTSTYATLNPTLAMRIESEDAAPVGRGTTHAEQLEITMVEVLDYDVRSYFAD